MFFVAAIPPPVPGRFTTPSGSPPPVDHHSKISVPTESICSVNSSSEVPVLAPDFSLPASPGIAAFHGDGHPPPSSKSHPLSFPTQNLNTNALTSAQSTVLSSPALITDSSIALSSIPATSGDLCSIQAPIWNPCSKSIPTPPVPFSSLFLPI